MNKILLVDDDLELTQLLTEILTLEGFDVTVAEDGEEGLLRLVEQAFDLVLLDPARPGALEVMSHVAALSPKRVVYVSCNPVTLARDSQVLVKGGYRLARLGMLDMFPHTGHLESMALFERI